ncbi:hypothetical protein HJC23_002913 [Cyclotella cryptica]|uniref:Trichohyalin-plectin-homology domain-containing protein n=1 Tax=Cyclotella cryptica TaxID=29204 RepID=A0ABD3PQQ4_9STRA|eukprot:CCRYP_012428-RA/>CCRYP_012428-RA protein AED:0.07 eAED:0.07 QI:0/1/0.5/1/1/1/2/235/867
MNDENLPPEQEDTNLSLDSVLAGAAVFGSLVFGTDYPEHSLCYSPSPVVNRRNQQNNNIDQFTEATRSLDFHSTSAISCKVKKEKTPDQVSERVANEVNIATIKRAGSSRDELLRNNKPRTVPKKSAGLKPSAIANTSDQRSSVNPIINEVRRSKEESIKEKILTAAEIREQRRIEREEAVTLNAEAEKTRREVLELRKQLNERFARAKIDRENRARQEHLANVENEIQFKSKVHVDHKQTLKEMEDARRRMSMDARAKLRQNHRDGKERMRLVAIAEDQALFEERYESSIATRNTKKKVAEQRRQSFAFRNGDARRIRELFAKMADERSIREHESYELKWAGERDADAYKQQMAKERRDSLAFRNAEGHRIRDLEATVKSDDWAREHESYELKWAGERDADTYKQQMAKERRDSLAFRNAEGHRIRDLEATMKSDDWAREHESYELKWAGERDADAYKQQMAKERRDSLAFRNAEGHRIRDLEATMKSDDWAREHESYELKWAGERDADAYKQQMAKERRDSLAFRNAEGHRIRDLEATMKSDDWDREHESYELKWAGERDADAYKQQMAKERRDSLAFRNADGHRIRDVEATMKSDDWAREHESYELKWAGERDANAYKQQMAKERRDSLAFRNREAAKHDAVMKELQTLARDKEHESYMLKWAGENDTKQYLADQQELRRQSLAFRNSQGKEHRELDEAMRVNQILENAKNEELAAACRKDVENYKAECASKERAALCLRGKEHFAIRVQEENIRQEKLEQDHQNHLLDTAAWQDVNAYVEECKRRRRLSLAFRAKEKRRHFELSKKQAALEVEQQHRDTRYRSEDARYVEIAKLREKARIAIESFKYSPDCSFGPNPFATLLD